jgi:hypothetical protein
MYEHKLDLIAGSYGPQLSQPFITPIEELKKFMNGSRNCEYIQLRGAIMNLKENCNQNQFK